MANISFAFNALAPLLVLAMIGYVLKQRGFFSDGFTMFLNKYIFYVALPVLIFKTLATIQGGEVIAWDVVLFSVITLITIMVLGFLITPFLGLKQPEKPVLVQSFFRGNFTLIGIPLALRLGGEEALSMIIILNAALIPLTNIVSIYTFRFYQNEADDHLSFLDLMRETMRNPIMLAMALGGIAFVLQRFWSPFITSEHVVLETLEMIAATATPMALIAIGGSFEFTRIKSFMRPLFIGVSARLVILPMSVFGLALLLQPWIRFDGSWPSMIAIFASPVAVSTVAVTQGLGGDERLASQLVIWTSALAMISLFVYISVFRALGLL